VTIAITIDGRHLEVEPGTTIWNAAREAGIEIPALCHDPQLEPVGVCRVCAVEIDGARVMAASCVREAEDGMVVRTASEKVERCRAMLTELLMSEQAVGATESVTAGEDRLFALARRYDVDVRLPRGAPRPADASSPAIAVDHQACILCDKCIRACDDLQHNYVIGRTGKGYGARIGFDLDDPMGRSTCVTCGECVAACPTGALLSKPNGDARPRAELKPVDSVCPYCGVGCTLTYHVDEAKGEIVSATVSTTPRTRTG
jgi:formate dehydrogenase major subunit